MWHDFRMFTTHESTLFAGSTTTGNEPSVATGLAREAVALFVPVGLAVLAWKVPVTRPYVGGGVLGAISYFAANFASREPETITNNMATWAAVGAGAARLVFGPGGTQSSQQIRNGLE